MDSVKIIPLRPLLNGTVTIIIIQNTELCSLIKLIFVIYMCYHCQDLWFITVSRMYGDTEVTSLGIDDIEFLSFSYSMSTAYNETFRQSVYIVNHDSSSSSKS